MDTQGFVKKKKKGSEGTFWSDGNILYLDCGSGLHRCIHFIKQSIYLKCMYFIVCNLFLNTVY